MDNKYYEIGGENYDRVSTILGVYRPERLIDWKVKFGKRESGVIGRKALKIGSAVHAMIESDIKEGGYSVRATHGVEVKRSMEAWEKFKIAHNPHVLATEQRVYCPHMKVAGTYDARTDTTLLDWKTSGYINESYWVQLAIYNHMSGLNLPKLGVGRFDKNLGEYEYEERDMDYEYVDIFKSLLKIKRYFEPDSNVNV